MKRPVILRTPIHLFGWTLLPLKQFLAITRMYNEAIERRDKQIAHLKSCNEALQNTYMEVITAKTCSDCGTPVPDNQDTCDGCIEDTSLPYY